MSPITYTFARKRCGVAIHPALPKRIHDFRSWLETTFEAGGPEGYQRKEEMRSPFEPGFWRIAPYSYGAAACIRGELEAEGYDVVTIQDPDFFGEERLEEINQRQKLDMEFLGNTDGVDQKFLEAIAGNSHGQIAVSHPGEVKRHIEMICRLMPRAHVFIAVSSNKEARSWCDLLTRCLPTPVKMASGSQESEGYQYVVGTFGKRYEHFRSREIVICPDAHWLRNGDRTTALPAVQEVPRFYSFVTGDSRNYEPRKLIEAYSGPVIYQQRGRHEQKTLYWDPPPARVQLRKEMTALERKRVLYWHNTPRNNCLADIADAWANSDIVSLWEYGLLLDQTEQFFEDRSVAQKGITIIVENTEHARELHRLLPDWTVNTGKSRPTETRTDNKSITTISALEVGGETETVTLMYAQGDLGTTLREHTNPKHVIKPSEIALEKPLERDKPPKPGTHRRKHRRKHRTRRLNTAHGKRKHG